jgi:uncharacterized membrane protein
VTFGANAAVQQAPGSGQELGNLAPLTAPTGTNIEGAVELGLAMLPAETNKRLVLLSDGGENAGDARAAARLAAARGVPLSYVDLSPPPGSAEALIAELHAPSNVRAGQQFELVATVESSAAQTARLRVLGDGQVVAERDVQLQPGLNRFPVKVDARGAGFQRYRAEIVPQQDVRAENNAAEAQVQVAEPPKVLLVIGGDGEGLAIKGALTAAKVDWEWIRPGELPTDLNQLGAYEAVALVNTPATALPRGAPEALRSYVRDLGKGLVMTGGDQAFGLGGYRDTPIEEALPVTMDAPSRETRPRLAIVYVLDKSSSMDACHCRGPSREKDGFFDKNGRPKIDLGKDAVVASVRALSPRDQVGVVAFDSSAHWAVPLQPGPAPQAVQNAIAPIPPKGATNVAAGLTAAEEALAKVDAQIKHVIVMTDGWSQEGDPMGVAQRMRNAGITLSVVAEGVGTAPFLQELAATGGGRFFAAQKIEDVPQIFLRETVQASSNYLIERPFTPQYAAPSPILSGLDNGLPRLYGYNGTTPKQSATVALVDADGSPILAQWQYGLGRAVAWTSDVKPQWAKDWTAWAEYPRFAAQMLSWVLPTVSSSGLNVDFASAGAQTQITVSVPQTGQPNDALDMRATVVGADGSRQEVALAAQAPGVYGGSFPSPPQGTYVVQVTGAQGGRVAVQETASLVVPYAPEYGLGQSDSALLVTLGKITGGGALAAPAEAFARLAQGAGAAQEIALPLLLLALILLPLDILVRRLAALWRTRSTVTR